MKIIILTLLTFILTACNQHRILPETNTLVGSWKMQKVTWISKDKSHPLENPHEGIFLFTPNSYSIQWTPTANPRTPFVLLSKPTDKEKMAGFSSVVFNAGSYEYTDNTVTATAYIAKVPGFEGGKQFYTYLIEGDTLTITMFDETYPDGTKPEWSGKWKTEFILIRVIG